MPSTLIRIAVGLLTFGLGVSATMFWIAFGTPEVKSLEAAPARTTACGMRPPMHLPTLDEPPPPPPPAPPSAVRRAPVSGGLLDGKAYSKPAPVYSSAAVAAGVSGRVRVRVLVDESGRVMTAEALSGDPLLREEAVQAAYQARFGPTLIEGVPVKVSGVISYNFVLP